MRMWCLFIWSFVLKVIPQMGHVAGVYTPSWTVLMWTFTLQNQVFDEYLRPGFATTTDLVDLATLESWPT